MESDPPSESVVESSLKLRLVQLQEAKANPVVQEIIQLLAALRESTITGVIELPIADQACLFTREQCIGEIRGLSRFSDILDNLIEETKQQVTDYESTTSRTGTDNRSGDERFTDNSELGLTDESWS